MAQVGSLDYLYPMLIRMVNKYRLVPNDDVYDLVQDTMYRVMKYKGGQGEYRLSYLFAVAKNIVYEEKDQRHKRNRYAYVPMDDTLSTPDTMLDEVNRGMVVERLLSHLPEDKREIVELFYWQDYNSDEIADMLGVAPSTVRDSLTRARRRMKEVIVEQYTELLQ